MSGADQFLQGLLVIPRDVTYDEDNKTLTRITEVWLTGEAATVGPTVIRDQGLLIGLGLQQGGNAAHKVKQFCAAIGIKDRYPQMRTDWMNLRKFPNFTTKLNAAFGHFGKWYGFEFAIPDEIKDLVPAPPDPACEALLFRLVIDNFKPNPQVPRRHFQVDATVVTVLGNFNLDDHYLLGLGALTTGKRSTVDGEEVLDVEDFMTLTQAMDRTKPRPLMPEEPGDACQNFPIGAPVAVPDDFKCPEPEMSASAAKLGKGKKAKLGKVKKAGRTKVRKGGRRRR